MSIRESKWEKTAARFRNAYDSGTDVEIIPSLKDLGIENLVRPKEMVGPYCRVSTKQESQVESFELQQKYYTEYVQRHENWELVDVYADPGISATSMKNRKDFNRLLDDCREGKVTKIVTKSVSRFARNVVDAIATVRMLRALPTPVGVFFETEHIDTLSRESDAQLSLLASFAESESINKSTSMKWAIRNRFARNIPRIYSCYGWIWNKEDYQLTMHPHTSRIVKDMYGYLFEGLNTRHISELLTSMKIPTPSGRSEIWTPSSVQYILCNERNCGDIIMQKTITVDVFTHKAVRNIGQERSYRIRDHHDKIVSREDWERARAILGQYHMKEFKLFDDEYIVEIDGESYHILDASKGFIP